MKILIIIIIALFTTSNIFAEKRWVQSKLPKESHEEYDLLTCLDSNNCYALGDLNSRIILYKSTNQGISWSEVFEKYHERDTIAISTFKGIILDSNNIYLTELDRIALEKSTDGGHSFETILFGELSTRSNEYFYDFAVYSKNISAGVTLSSLIFTNDSWESSSIVTIPDSINSSEPLFHLDSNNIVIARYNDFNLEFINFNKQDEKWSIWSRGEKRVNEYEKLVNLQFLNDSLGYACGHQNILNSEFAIDLIWKTTNGGKSWVKIMNQLNEPKLGLRRISFQNEKHGIVIGNWGKILETTDGGESWFQHPIQKEMASLGSEIVWAGSTPLFAAWSVGIFRLETITDVEELSTDEKFRVFQSGDNLEIAINDESFSTYIFNLYNSSGQSLMTKSIKSSFGFVFEPVELINLTNGVYYYTISKNNGVEFNGKMVVVE